MSSKANQIQTIDDRKEVSTVATPMEIMSRAVERGVDADQLEKLLTLQERYEANQARVAFTEAMSDFQARCPVIRKSKQADRYVYAPYEEIMHTIRPHLDSCGLSVRFSTKLEKGIITCICTVSHRQGHSEESEFFAPVDEQMRVNQTQKVGSANSYAKRYALVNALNLASSDVEYDDDGYSAGTSYITDEQVVEIRDYIDALEIDEPKYLQVLGAKSVEEIPENKHQQAMSLIKRKEKQVNGK